MSQIRFTLRMNEELNEQLKELAEKDNRSLNNYLITVLEEHVKDKIKDIQTNK